MQFRFFLIRMTCSANVVRTSDRCIKKNSKETYFSVLKTGILLNNKMFFPMKVAMTRT